MTTVAERLGDPRSVGVWGLDFARSRITFKNKTMWGAMRVHGAFTEFTGLGQVTESGKVMGKIDIAAASLNTKLRMRDEDLRRPNYLDVQQYPQINVLLSGVTATGGDAIEVDAEFTIKGRTARLPVQSETSVLDDGSVRMTITTTLFRKDWGVTGNVLGTVGNKTDVRADLVFQRDHHQNTKEQTGELR